MVAQFMLKNNFLLHGTYLYNSPDSYLCFQQVLPHSMFYFLFLYQSPSSSLCMVFDSTSSNIDEVLLINPSANDFVFGDFNVHHKDWLTHSRGTDRPGELCYNFPIPNDFTQMVNFPTRIPDWDSHSTALLDLILSSDAGICSTMAFLPLGNSHHVVSVSTELLSNSQQDAPFHHIAYDYSCADWDGLGRMFHGRISLRLLLVLLLVNFVSGFSLELMYISLIENISLTHLHGF